MKHVAMTKQEVEQIAEGKVGSGELYTEQTMWLATALLEAMEALKKQYYALQIGHNDYTDYGAKELVRQFYGEGK